MGANCEIQLSNFTDTGDSSNFAHLMELEGSKERLHLFQANLSEDGSFDSAIDGCEGVFHAASPVLFSVTDPQEELIEPAVKGTLNVLRSCKKVPSVKRVVLTSSMAAVMFNSNPLNPDGIVDEACFSDPVFCKEQEQWYCLSKTLAEEVAWKFADENGIDLVVMNPGLVIGPLLQPTLNSTSEMILNIIKEGRTDYPEYSVVDVKDVALAHILAMESPSASGRYCLSGTLLSASEVLKILHKLYPHLNHLQNIAENQHNVNPHPNRVSQEKAKRLGISFTPFEVSLKDIVESLKEKNFLSF
ncbi:tetraketide alpha-pyrone reductase 1-like [Olea europaea var. sylvestris]|uniref:tetraketide alpha-pyrone reductase 1-like n=1 Tax=Olea europaea var. sylvestris TaxID=158386 RepID=UPI000C1D4BD5|nr:tetraketide alpha-pyrone reductase 1-like [Olea europaea var. sylvestris]